ncbi:MAG TPA: amidase [Gemmatimonadaceae bacterium]|nr:amidase [Gemmatimonadaceae bacterium]
MSYDLVSLKLPRLGTGGLRTLARLLENPVTGHLLVEKLKRDAGLARIRVDSPAEPPTFVPLLAADDAPVPPLVRAAPPGEAPGFHFPGMDDYADAYRSGRVTPEQVAEQFLTQMERSDRDAGKAPLKAFIAVSSDDVRKQARASTERWRTGRTLGPFDGVPVSVKDELDQAGYPTTVGTKFLGHAAALEDATVVARLRAAGALLVGKANMHEIGINITGLNPHHGTTRNPYNDAYHTGGSSSGPATTVAAGLVPVAIGADGGGSIRIPAAFCGLVGIKATFGRVSEFGAAPLCWSVGHVGPMAGSVRDCARTYALVAGPDPRDPQTLGHPPVEIDDGVPGSLEGVRFGVYWNWFRHATADVVDRCERLARALVERGATLHEVEIPELDAMRVAHIVTITGELAAAMTRYYGAHRSELSLDARVNLVIAGTFSAAEYVNAQRIRTRAITAFTRAFAGVDAILTPATGQVAPRINPAAQPFGESDLSMTTEVMRFAFASNFTGHPAISFPAGYDAAGLPIGLQAIGRPWGERLLFRVAAAAESIVERRAPVRWYSPLGQTSRG